MSKFSPAEVHVKKALKKLRLDTGLNMKQGAKLMGFSVKKLEDLEATRNYGCHVSVDVLMQAVRKYNLSDAKTARILKPTEKPVVQVVRKLGARAHKKAA